MKYKNTFRKSAHSHTAGFSESHSFQIRKRAHVEFGKALIEKVAQISFHKVLRRLIKSLLKSN